MWVKQLPKGKWLIILLIYPLLEWRWCHEPGTGRTAWPCVWNPSHRSSTLPPLVHLVWHFPWAYTHLAGRFNQNFLNIYQMNILSFWEIRDIRPYLLWYTSGPNKVVFTIYIYRLRKYGSKWKTGADRQPLTPKLHIHIRKKILSTFRMAWRTSA